MFYSAYLPVVEDTACPHCTRPLPCCGSTVCIRRTGCCGTTIFRPRELLTEDEPNFDPYLDPKCTWAVRHPEFFPVEVNTASREELLRVPGIGPKSALRIFEARRLEPRHGGAQAHWSRA